MKITICGSIAFFDEMQEIERQLIKMGHEVKLPPSEIIGEDGQMISVKKYYEIRKASSNNDEWVWERKEKAIRTHFDKIVWSDVVLILNYTKNNISDYIGANTLLEMGLAFHLNKKIYLLNNVPEISYKEEILGMRPIVIDGNLSLIR